MTQKSSESSFSDLDLKIGIARAMGNSHEKVAEIAETSVPTVRRRLAETQIARLESITRTILAKNDARIAEAAAVDAKTRVTRILAKALGASERLVDTAIESGDFTQLLAAHKVGEWAAKFEMSEAPKRLQVDSTSTQTIKHVVSLEEAANVLETRRLIRPAALIAADSGAEVIEAERIDA